MRNLDGDGNAMVESPQVPTRTKVGTLHLSAGTNVTPGPCSYCQYSHSTATELSTCHRDLLVIKPKLSTVWFITEKGYCIFATLKWLSQSLEHIDLMNVNQSNK